MSSGIIGMQTDAVLDALSERLTLGPEAGRSTPPSLGHRQRATWAREAAATRSQASHHTEAEVIGRAVRAVLALVPDLRLTPSRFAHLLGLDADAAEDVWSVLERADVVHRLDGSRIALGGAVAPILTNCLEASNV